MLDLSDNEMLPEPSILERVRLLLRDWFGPGPW
jgi:hypothetical protein